MGAEGRLTELGIRLPECPHATANYVQAVQVGDLLFLAGHGPLLGMEGPRGKLGRDLSVEEGYKAARATGLNLLASMRTSLGSLDRVRRIVKVLGMVASADGFAKQPEVVDGFSDLMVQVFGEKGRHARSAVGMAELPLGIPIEIEAIVEIDTAEL